MPTIAFAGGGSAGHIAPSIAVAKAIKEDRPDIDIHFICSTKPEDKAFIEKEGFNCSQIEAPRLSPTFPWKFFKAVKQAKKILNEIKPDVLFSKGGYVSVPVALAAKGMSIPIVMHESDAVGGKANQLVAKWADVVCQGMNNEKLRMNNVFTGNPIRESVIQGKADKGFKIAGFEGRNKPILLIYGGSQGSQAFNEFVKKNIDELLELVDVIHITGKGKSGADPHEGYYSTEFVNEELPHFYAAADLCISRAGANAITELAANNIPTILIPLRGVGHDHQQKNAELASPSDLFTVVQQSEMENKLLVTINNVLTCDVRRATCDIYNPEAARQIADILLKYLPYD